ncbi:MAG: dephospho-CoA kinase, partial [Candidatus Aminicenantes bacterium]|nr:dephospho-CoA kinase [Candidatus Aminicenantes bacterium]
QIQRLMERDRISRRQALQKIRSQMPLAEKIKYADYVINTSVSLEKTAARSEEIFRCLMSDYWKKSRQAGGTKRPNVRRGEKLRGAES